MKFTNIALIIAALSTIPFAAAGAPDDPEITDAAGDAIAALDITSAWISSGTTESGVPTLVFTIQLRDLANPDPFFAQAGDYGYYYIVRFDASSSPTNPVELQGKVRYTTTPENLGFPAIAGQWGQSNHNGITTFTMDKTNNQVTLTTRGNVRLLIEPGVVISNLHVFTASDQRADPLIPPTATIKDQAGPGYTYEI